MSTIAANKIRASIVIEKADKAALEEIAKEEDRSLNYIINKAIKEYIKKSSKNK